MSMPKYQPQKLKLRLFTCCFIAIVCLLAAFPPTSAAGNEAEVIYVDQTASGGDDGKSWGNAFKDLKDALDKAKNNPGDTYEIWVAAGTYKPTDDNDRTKSFVLSNGIALYGGFSGTETAREQRKPAENHTILSGAIDDGQNSYHVVYADGAGKTAVLDGFTITDGNANDDDTNKDGGGMYINGGNPTVTNCNFLGNYAIHAGGGIYINTGAPTVTNCNFSVNAATSGGGVYIISGLPTFTNCTFSRNNANNVGGGMYIKGASPKLTNCDFSGNSAYARGGGMYMHDNSSPTLTNCTFSWSCAWYGGGMYITNNSSPTLTNCTFLRNASSENGGGMYIENSSPALMNCTFSVNTATTNDGDGMYIQSGNPTVINTIFWGEYDTARQVEKDGGTLTISYSVVDTVFFSGEGNTDADPKLGPLADNGGPTKTCALLEGSSAIDSGTASGAPKSDQRGVPRPQGAGVDIGAYERAPEQPDSPEGSGGGCSAGPASPWTLALLAPLAPLARRRRPGRRGR